ncbi:MAG: bifunctional fructose-bisphosphatase/inositol-phosphate phosphatase [Methanomicrobiales archaeon]|nr:bifunctional fructose-bisphosphatase/inositol-phosphate phosphatase [Methanomicrobiales archaeon]
MSDFFRVCDEIADAVTEISEELAGTVAGAEVVGLGADGTPTKKIDRVAEDCAIEYLKASQICSLVISEEAGKVALDGEHGTVFLDPIDGTFNATRGIPFFAISIAFAVGGKVTKGYVRDIPHGESFSAEKGKGAFIGEKRIHVSKTSTLHGCAMSIYGRKFDPNRIFALGGRVRRWRLLGASALELCYVAAGRIDGFIDIRETLRVTDAAAGMLICREAGGIVTDANGEELTFPEEVSIGRTIVATNGYLHGKVIEYIR